VHQQTGQTFIERVLGRDLDEFGERVVETAEADGEVEAFALHLTMELAQLAAL
jgi:hypothetical protein